MAAHITHIVLLRSTRRLPNAQELPKHTEHLSTLHKMRTVLCTRCSQVQNSLFKILCVFCFVYDTLTTNQCKLLKVSISYLTFSLFFAWLILIKFYLYSYLWGTPDQCHWRMQIVTLRTPFTICGLAPPFMRPDMLFRAVDFVEVKT